MKIILQCSSQIQKGAINCMEGEISQRHSKSFKGSMGALIQYVKFFNYGFIVATCNVSTAIEAPKGEFGVYLVADGTNKPYRCKIRAPGFAHLQSIDYLGKGHLLPDLSAILGSLDLVFGEVDR